MGGLAPPGRLLLGPADRADLATGPAAAVEAAVAVLNLLIFVSAPQLLTLGPLPEPHEADVLLYLSYYY